MIEILQYEFMQRAFLAGIVVAVICSLLGVFLVLKRLSLIGDGLAHVAFGGVALGLFLGINPVLSALGLCIFAGFLTYHLTSGGRLYGETAIGLMIATGLSAGVILISLAKGFTTNLFNFLFGSILTIKNFDLALTVVLGIIIIFCIRKYYREFIFLCFDEESAQAAGVNVRFLSILLNILTAITVVVSIQLVGILLVSALIVVPVAASMQIARSFAHTVSLSIAFSVLSVICGLLASYYWNFAAAGAIVACALLLFSASFLFKKVLH